MTKTQACVLFDLDGTLVDTAPDIIAALDHVRQNEGREPVDYELARDYVSHGTAALINFGFGDSQPESDFRRRSEQLLDHYRSNLSRLSSTFDGIDELLETLESRSIPWGIVTNKPAWLTDPLLEELGLHQRSACAISGDTLTERKPHPLPMTTAASLAGVEARQCLYLGDAVRDIEAGNAAGMTTLIANWGYIDSTQKPEDWNADGCLDHPMDCLRWLPATN